MTDKALEAAAKALIDIDPCISGHHESHVALKLPYAKAAVSAYLSALPGEAEVVAWRVYHDWEDAPGEDYYIGPADNGSLDKAVAVRLSHDNANRIVAALASLQAMQARAEKAERERDHWKANHAEMVQRNAVLRERPDLPADRLPSIARYEARVKELEKALGPFAAITEIPALGCVTKDMVITARTALTGGSNG